MHHALIKLCGFSDVELAKAAVKLGVDYIGIVFHPSSARNVSPEQARLISQAVKEQGAQAVGIFVNQGAEEIQAIAQAADINIVQLHGERARRAEKSLPAHYQRIYAIDPSFKALDELKALIPHRDFLLLDSPHPGQGIRLNEKELSQLRQQLPLGLPWFLAGGLNTANVKAAMTKFKPDGIDASSSLELSKGKKDLGLIQDFVSSLRGYYP